MTLTGEIPTTRLYLANRCKEIRMIDVINFLVWHLENLIRMDGYIYQRFPIYWPLSMCLNIYFEGRYVKELGYSRAINTLLEHEGQQHPVQQDHLSACKCIFKPQTPPDNQSIKWRQQSERTPRDGGCKSARMDQMNRSFAFKDLLCICFNF